MSPGSDLSLGLARALSILGHPALLMPGAVVWASIARNAPPSVLFTAASASVFVALCVGVYSAVQVRAGRWVHVDASVPRERGQLNLFLALLLFGTAGALWWTGQPRPVFLGLALGGGLVVVGHLLRRWLKVSLHAGFAVFATGLARPSPVAFRPPALAEGVCRSPLVLHRHPPPAVAVALVAHRGAAFQSSLRPAYTPTHTSVTPAAF